MFSAVCFNTGPSNHARPIPINIDNGLPAIAMQFGISEEKEMSFNVHLDSCAGLNIGNLDVLLIHILSKIIFNLMIKINLNR